MTVDSPVQSQSAGPPVVEESIVKESYVTTEHHELENERYCEYVGRT